MTDSQYHAYNLARDPPDSRDYITYFKNMFKPKTVYGNKKFHKKNFRNKNSCGENVHDKTIDFPIPVVICQ